MAAIEQTITVEQGATYATTISFKQADGSPLDLTGYVVRFTARRTPKGRLLVEASTENGLITFMGIEPVSGLPSQSVDPDPTTGIVRLELPSTITDDFSVGESLYDLELQQVDYVRRVLRGPFVVLADVVKARPGE
jgi:hypothetical protein